jgi:hypothetical protein
MTTEDAVKFYGTPVKLAEALGLTPEAIYQWPEKPPILRQYQLEVLTKRKLRAETEAA